MRHSPPRMGIGRRSQRFVVGGVVLAGIAAAASCGFGEYHTVATGGASSSSATETTSSGSMTSTTSTSTSMSGSSSSGMSPGCPMPGALAMEDCWTLASESAAGNLACVTTSATPTKLPDDGASSIRFQRLRSIRGEAYAVGSANKLNPSALGTALIRPVGGTPPIQNADEPKMGAVAAGVFVELDDIAEIFEAPSKDGYPGVWTGGSVLGDAVGLDASGSDAIGFFQSYGLVSTFQRGEAREQSSGEAGYGRVVAVATSASMGDGHYPLFGVLLQGSGGMCNGAAGVYLVGFDDDVAGANQEKCVPVAETCLAPDDPSYELAPFDMVGEATSGVLAGQTCAETTEPGTTLDSLPDPTGTIVRFHYAIGTSPQVDAHTLLTPSSGGSVDIAGIRAVGTSYVVAGTFRGTATATGVAPITSAGGGTDAFVGILDASLAWKRLVAFGGVGDDGLTDLSVTEKPGSPGEFAILVVGSFNGQTSWGCFDGDSATPSAYVAKIALGDVAGAGAAPEVLFFKPLGTMGTTRAERVLVPTLSSTTAVITGRVEANSTLTLGSDTVQTAAAPASFVLEIENPSKITP